MKVEIKATTLTDGSKVWDVNILANSNPKFGNKCINSCTSEENAHKFALKLESLVRVYTVESFEIIEHTMEMNCKWCGRSGGNCTDAICLDRVPEGC